MPRQFNANARRFDERRQCKIQEWFEKDTKNRLQEIRDVIAERLSRRRSVSPVPMNDAEVRERRSPSANRRSDSVHRSIRETSSLLENLRSQVSNSPVVNGDRSESGGGGGDYYDGPAQWDDNDAWEDHQPKSIDAAADAAAAFFGGDASNRPQRSLSVFFDNVGSNVGSNVEEIIKKSREDVNRLESAVRDDQSVSRRSSQRSKRSKKVRSKRSKKVHKDPNLTASGRPKTFGTHAKSRSKQSELSLLQIFGSPPQVLNTGSILTRQSASKSKKQLRPRNSKNNKK